jgi:hypothetical protein
MSRRCPLPQDRQPRAEASKEFTSRPACSRGPLELGFHRQLSADRIFVALNGKDSEIAARAAEADEAIPMSEIALDKRLVPCLRMADIADRKVEMLRPEEWDHHKRLVFTQQFRGRAAAFGGLDKETLRILRQVKEHTAESHGRVAKLLAPDECGFIETVDGREIYFHRNAVLDGAYR